MKTLTIASTILALSVYVPSEVAAQASSEEDLNWQTKFEDPGTGDWTDGWFLDGTRATVQNTDQGMLLTAGPIQADHASHCVLWTRQSFTGDVRIEYDYWRMDTINRNVNIIFIQATGTGDGPYSTDISQWSHLREIPYMSTYYTHMKLLHISYAAYAVEGSDQDYVRARRYPINPELGFDDIELPPDTFDTGLFQPGVREHITIIKRGDKLHMKVSNDSKTMNFAWDTSAFPPITEGRIGLRQMWTRSARYANFTVSTLER